MVVALIVPGRASLGRFSQFAPQSGGYQIKDRRGRQPFLVALFDMAHPPYICPEHRLNTIYSSDCANSLPKEQIFVAVILIAATAFIAFVIVEFKKLGKPITFRSRKHRIGVVMDAHMTKVLAVVVPKPAVPKRNPRRRTVCEIISLKLFIAIRFVFNILFAIVYHPMFLLISPVSFAVSNVDRWCRYCLCRFWKKNNTMSPFNSEIFNDVEMACQTKHRRHSGDWSVASDGFGSAQLDLVPRSRFYSDTTQAETERMRIRRNKTRENIYNSVDEQDAVPNLANDTTQLNAEKLSIGQWILKTFSKKSRKTDPSEQHVNDVEMMPMKTIVRWPTEVNLEEAVSKTRREPGTHKMFRETDM